MSLHQRVATQIRRSWPWAEVERNRKFRCAPPHPSRREMIMTSYAITAEHWQAALEVPKQIALDLAAPLNLRLQAVRMVQAMLKVILKEEKDRDAPTAPVRQAKKTVAMPSSARACEALNDLTPQNTSGRHADEDDGMAPVGGQAIEQARETRNPSGQSSSPEPAEARTRYIGRVGPRKIRKKRK